MRNASIDQNFLAEEFPFDLSERTRLIQIAPFVFKLEFTAPLLESDSLMPGRRLAITRSRIDWSRLHTSRRQTGVD